MKIVKLISYSPKNDSSQRLYVVQEDTGWLHIMKLPFITDNTFFSKEEIEMVVGEELILAEEYDVDIDRN